MITYLCTLVADKDHHSMMRASSNFCIICSQIGWREVEQAQLIYSQKANGFHLYKKATSKFANKIYACCIEDYTFKHKYGKHVHNLLTISVHLVVVCAVCWRFQKNLMYRHIIELQALPADLEWCFVKAALRVFNVSPYFATNQITWLLYTNKTLVVKDATGQSNQALNQDYTLQPGKCSTQIGLGMRHQQK